MQENPHATNPAPLEHQYFMKWREKLFTETQVDTLLAVRTTIGNRRGRIGKFLGWCKDADWSRLRSEKGLPKDSGARGSGLDMVTDNLRSWSIDGLNTDMFLGGSRTWFAFRLCSSYSTGSALWTTLDFHRESAISSSLCWRRCENTYV